MTGPSLGLGEAGAECGLAEGGASSEGAGSRRRPKGGAGCE